MTYSGSGSSYDFLEFRIRIKTKLFIDACLGIIKNTLNLIIKNWIYQLSAIFCFTIQPFNTHSPEFTGLNSEIKFFNCSLIFCWIRIQNNNSGSGSGSTEKFWIHVDPDTQHCFNQTIFLQLLLVLWIPVLKVLVLRCPTWRLVRWSRSWPGTTRDSSPGMRSYSSRAWSTDFTIFSRYSTVVP